MRWACVGAQCELCGGDGPPGLTDAWYRARPSPAAPFDLSLRFIYDLAIWIALLHQQEGSSSSYLDDWLYSSYPSTGTIPEIIHER
jgi:hypothetical protein